MRLYNNNFKECSYKEHVILIAFNNWYYLILLFNFVTR